ncbi:MAG: hypothetical protein PQJ46_06900 [Spirochaetales bacterium]|nr:hypothetical protein [Spirochaetales bacterium]
MRAAVIYFADKRRAELESFSKSVAKGLEAQGHSVDVFNAKDFNRKLAIYQFAVIGTESCGTFGGKIPEGFSKYLESIGPVISLHSFAFIVKKGLRCEKSLQVMMKNMESEGMFVVYSDVLENEAAAEAASKKLIIK